MSKFIEGLSLRDNEQSVENHIRTVIRVLTSEWMTLHPHGPLPAIISHINSFGKSDKLVDNKPVINQVKSETSKFTDTNKIIGNGQVSVVSSTKNDLGPISVKKPDVSSVVRTKVKCEPSVKTELSRPGILGLPSLKFEAISPKNESADNIMQICDYPLVTMGTEPQLKLQWGQQVELKGEQLLSVVNKPKFSSSFQNSGSSSSSAVSVTKPYNRKLKKTIPVFSGDMTKFSKFLKRFMHVVDETTLHNSHKLQILQNKLQGQPAKLVSELGDKTYQSVLSHLKGWYNKPAKFERPHKNIFLNAPRFVSKNKDPTFESIFIKVNFLYELIKIIDIEPEWQRRLCNELLEEYQSLIPADYLDRAIPDDQKLCELLNYMKHVMFVVQEQFDSIPDEIARMFSAGGSQESRKQN